MDTLRVILLILGILLLAGIYLADRLKRRQSKRERHWGEIDIDEMAQGEGRFTTRDEPAPVEWVDKRVSLSARRNEPLPEENLEGLAGLGRDSEEEIEMPAAAPGDERPARPEDAVIVLTVMAGEGRRFTGPWLLKVLQELGLEHGEGGLFHYRIADRDEPLFSVANILEPGRFELGEIVTLETPGIALFMRLPAVVAGTQALQTLLQKSRQMAAQLSGTLCDEQRLPLSEQRLAELEQQARGYTAG